MEPPRHANPGELPSLLRLVDTVFTQENPNMLQMFPTLFAESNAENLFVVADQGRIVSHVGMTLQRAALAGCSVGVACVGAVATYEEYRGKGFATHLMEVACERAKAWGADFMMISGGRGLYRRLGAADVGLDHQAEVGIDGARFLFLDGFYLEPVTDEDLPVCASLYETKTAHFLRTPSEWSAYFHSGFCMCRKTDLFLVRRGTATLAYCAVSHDAASRTVHLLEFAGDSVALAAVFHPLISRYEASTAWLHLQSHDTALRSLLTDAGASLEPGSTSGTFLLLDLERLLRRMQPFFETRVGYRAARDFRVREEDGCFCFSGNGEVAYERVASGKMEATERIFGSRKHDGGEGLLGRAFPIPSLWYGLSYV
jgi:predicted N-acetyltransferase YhbS